MIKVIDKNDLLKYLVQIAIIVLAIILTTKYFNFVKGNALNNMLLQTEYTFVSCINTVIPIMNYNVDEKFALDIDNHIINNKGLSSYNKILNMELNMLRKH